jgi:hypothetical protein
VTSAVHKASEMQCKMLQWHYVGSGSNSFETWKGKVERPNMQEDVMRVVDLMRSDGKEVMIRQQ